MALVIGGAATVATGMSPIVDAALAADDIFIDGLSFSSDHEIGNAGQIQVVCGTVDAIDPTVPGAEFNHNAYANTVKDINCNNSFKDSVKVPSYFEASMPVDVLMSKTEQVTQSVRIGRQKAILAAVVYALDSDHKGAVTGTVLTDIMTARKALRKKNANPNVVIADVDTYSAMLETAGSKYIPYKNEEMVVTGRIGYYMGMLWIECSLMGETSQSVKFYDASGTLRTVDVSAVKFIMYQHDKLAVVDRLDALRVKESENFIGSLVQEELVAGILVKNADAFFLGYET